MVRRKKVNHQKSLMQSAEKNVKGGELLGPALGHLLSSGSAYEKYLWIRRDYSGLDYDGKWKPSYMVNGWGPVVGVTFASVLVHKVIGLIRRL